MNEPLRVTFLFKDETQFKNFLESAQVETFTYNLKKKEYTVDLSTDVKSSMSVVSPEPPPKQTPPSTSVSDFI